MPTLDHAPPSRPCYVGLWVDHEKTHIVHLRGDQVACTRLESNVQRRSKTTGGLRMPGRSYINNAVASEKKRDRRYADQLQQYYHHVLDAVANADRFVIVGPGAAKNEVAKAARADPQVAERMLGVETAAAMSERQLIAYIKDYFGKSSPRLS